MDSVLLAEFHGFPLDLQGADGNAPFDWARTSMRSAALEPIIERSDPFKAGALNYGIKRNPSQSRSRRITGDRLNLGVNNDNITGICDCDKSVSKATVTDSLKISEYSSVHRGKVQLIAADLTVERSVDGSTPEAVLRIRRTGQLGKELTLPVDVVDDTAESGSDFRKKILEKSEIYFAPGDPVGRLRIPLLPTDRSQPSEKIELMIGGEKPSQPETNVTVNLLPARLGFFDITKGTSIRIRNDTGDWLYYNLFKPYSLSWETYKLKAGFEAEISYEWPAFDDIEMRFFETEQSANANNGWQALELDADNPAFGPPWISFQYGREYFQSEGEEHLVTGNCPHKANSSWWWKREADSPSRKRFSLHIKSLAVRDDGSHNEPCYPMPF